VLAVIAPLALVAVLVAALGSPPAALGKDAPPDVFSAGRAMDDVRGLTASGLPHPSDHYDGSERTPQEIADHDRARDYVVGRLRAMGLTPEVQSGRACGRFTCAGAENVVARIEGSEPGPAVMLVAHYDSTPMGPGAADDGAGVASILETVRALQTGPKPRRSLIVLIDDSEEMGLVGARVFGLEHRWAKDVGVVLNFEARGTSGQAAMFETSNGNADLIGLFASGTERPIASSVIYTLYKRLPNDTDLSVFKQLGMQGLNFAFADRVFDYHTPGDTSEELDPRSLQHMGAQALGVTRALLAAPSLPKPAGDAVYFDFLTLGMIRYPAGLTGPLAILGALAAALVIRSAVKKGRTKVKRVLLAAAVWLGALVTSTLAGVGLQLLLKKIRFPNVGSGPLAMRQMMGDHHPFAPWLALVALSAAVTLAFALRLCPGEKVAPASPAKDGGDAKDGDDAKRAENKAQTSKPTKAPDAIALAGGALVLWNVFSLLLGFVAPGASYLFTLVALFAAGGLALSTRDTASSPSESDRAQRRDSVPQRGPRARQLTMGVALAIVPAAFLWFPIVRVLLIMVAGTMAPGATLPIMLLASLGAPLVADAPSRLKWSLPLAAAALTVIATIVACVLR